MENTQPTTTKWYQTTWAAVLFLFLFFPVGLYLMWKYTKWNKTVKWVISGFFGLLILTTATSPKSSTTTTPQPTQDSQQALVTVEPTNETVKTTSITAPPSNETVSQKNAVRKAKSYLAYTAFSHDGLVAQLEFEKFPHEDAVYGADNSGGDWNQQAAKKAKAYMDQQAFSRDGLIHQLLFEKFTQGQAEFGANSVGL